MIKADFYVGLGGDAKWVGSLSNGGQTPALDELNLFGPGNPQDDFYTEDTFLDIVEEAAADGDYEHGYTLRHGDVWPWAYPSSADGTDMVYAFNKGSIHVFERTQYGEEGEDAPWGLFLIAMHYPNGARKPSTFPAQGAAA